MNLALLGFAMVAIFMTLIMTKRMSALSALIVVPVVCGLIAGAGAGLGAMMLQGVVLVVPTALMLAFAVLYFGLMIDVGLFDPLVRRILATVGRDPLRIAIGTAALAMLVSVDGDGTTTALVTISALLPVYRAVGMNPLILLTLLGSSNSLMNYVPWGGPSARAATAVHVDLARDIFLPMLPAMIAGLLAVFVLAWFLGRGERRRLGWTADAVMPARTDTAAVPPERRPALFWFNLVLTVGLVLGMIASLAPLAVLIMGAFAIAATVNYPRLSEQRARIAAHADNVVAVMLLIFAAGAFTGILGGTGMVDAMARSVLAVLPPAAGPYLAPITALVSIPLTFLMSNDAYYFGVVPVIARTAATFGVPAAEIARASLLGQIVHALSPLLAPIYLACALIEVDVADAQRFALRYALAITAVVLFVAMLTGAIPLR